MATIDQLLVDGEYIIQEFEISPMTKKLIKRFLCIMIIIYIIQPFGAVGYCIGFVVCLFLLLRGWAILSQLSSTQAGITNKRIYISSKYMGVTFKDIALTKVESTDIIQGVIGKKHDYGSIEIKGVGQVKIVLYPIKHPYEVHRTIVTTIDNLN